MPNKDDAYFRKLDQEFDRIEAANEELAKTCYYCGLPILEEECIKLPNMKRALHWECFFDMGRRL